MCDVKAMENVVMEMKYDANKAPLGWLVFYSSYIIRGLIMTCLSFVISILLFASHCQYKSEIVCSNFAANSATTQTRNLT